MSIEKKKFDAMTIQAISKALGATEEGLTNSQIDTLLDEIKNSFNIQLDNNNKSKWKRIYDLLCELQDKSDNNNAVFEFIKMAINTVNFNDNEKYEKLRFKINEVLIKLGFMIFDTGELVVCEKSTRLLDAKERALGLKNALESRNIHEDVLKFCKPELLQDNYFHAVLEAVKSVFYKLKQLSGLDLDGHELVRQCLEGKNPKIAINSYKKESEKTEQNGLASLIKGIYSMFRNPLAHEAKINWEITKQDAEDLLTIVSMVHRRLDKSINRF